MSVGFIRQITNLRYAGYYIPLISAVYLHNEGASGLSISGHSFPALNGEFFLITLGGLFLGAIVNHGMYRSIFGRGGPRQNPKDKWTVRYQRVALLFWKHPKIRPSSLSELEDRFFEGIDRLTSSSLLAALVLGRFLCLVIIQLMYSILTLSIFIILGMTVIRGSIDYLGFGLFTAQAVFLIAPKFWKRFATVIPENAAEWIFVPEHRRASTLFDDDDIDFQRDPRGLFDDLLEVINSLTHSDEETDNDTDYLIPLKSDEPEYLISLEKASSEGSDEE